MTQFIKSALLRCFASADSEEDNLFSGLSEIAPVPGENRQQNLFRKAVTFAKEDIKNPRRRNYYVDKSLPGQSAFNTAVSLYLKSHKVHH